MSASSPELEPRVTRRDFLNASLIGTGAALLHGCARGGEIAEDDPDAAWNGPGGVGSTLALTEPPGGR